MTATGTLIHIWNRCHNCGADPIVGARYECQVCPAGSDNDLCEACYRLFEQGRAKHPLPNARPAPPGTSHVFRPVEGTARDSYLRYLTVPWSNAAPPTAPERFVVRPEFCSGHDSYFGAYGFVVAAEQGGPPFLITALHVMDELIKSKGIDCTAKNAAYTGRELPPLVTAVNLYDVYAKNWMISDLGTAGQMLTLPGARLGFEEPNSQSDIAAFRVAPSASVTPARLAAAAPALGEPIFLAVNSGAGASSRLTPAITVESTERTFIFRFQNPVTLPPHGSGAPLLNRAGEVVGINVGGGKLEGQKLGHANHAASIRRHLGWQRA